MKVLIACEHTGKTRDAFTALGHDAMSCDLKPSETKGKHYQGSVLDILNGGFHLMIAHPPCTHLSKAGGWCWKFKQAEQQEAFEFVKQLWNAPIEMIAIENPIGWLNTNWMKPTQIIHPYYFGDEWMKETCLWLKNLPKLKYCLSDNLFEKATAVEPKGNWVKPGNNRPHRRFNDVKEGGKGNATDRSRSFESISKAMAEQWSFNSVSSISINK